jgi:hypothetical protein
VSFPFDLHSAAVFDSHIPCRSHAVPLPFPCRSPAVPLPFPCRSPAMPRICISTIGSWRRRGMVTACEQLENGTVLCESNNSIGRLEAVCWPPASFWFVLLPRGVCRVVAGSWHGTGMVCVNRALKRHWNGMGTAWYM